LEEIVAALVKKTETNDRGFVALTTQHPLSAKVGTTSPTSGSRSVSIVRSRTEATEFFLILSCFSLGTSSGLVGTHTHTTCIFIDLTHTGEALRLRNG
jgi:hypothetical protein